MKLSFGRPTKTATLSLYHLSRTMTAPTWATINDELQSGLVWQKTRLRCGREQGFAGTPLRCRLLALIGCEGITSSSSAVQGRAGVSAAGQTSVVERKWRIRT